MPHSYFMTGMLYILTVKSGRLNNTLDILIYDVTLTHQQEIEEIFETETNMIHLLWHFTYCPCTKRTPAIHHNATIAGTVCIAAMLDFTTSGIINIKNTINEKTLVTVFW